MIEASPVTGFHLVFLEKEPHAAGQAVADLAGTADDLAPVHAHAFHRHAEFLGPARHGQVRFRILQERLGGNAAPVQAGSPHPVALHARHGFSHLGGANGAHISGGAATNDDQIILHERTIKASPLAGKEGI